MKPVIDIKDLNVTYFLGRKQEIHALENISLQIYPGEFIIFFGPSGCGKSTLLYSIAGLETHARGQVLVAEKNVEQMTPHEAAEFRQKEIGMIFQAFYLISTLNVIDNVVLPQIAIGASPKARAKTAQDLLEHFGVGSQSKKRPTELSGGQQQRVAICRALMNNPQILLADEPVGNLDSKSSNDVIQLIHDLNSVQKKTVILVTHDPSHLHLAHRVFYIRDGKIIDIKVNQAINDEVVAATQAAKPRVPKELELLLRTFTSMAPDQVGTLLIPFKAKEIVAEVMTGLSVEKLTAIEHAVQQLIIDASVSPLELRDFLDRSERFGGLGLDHRTAVHLTEQMAAVIREIKELQALSASPVSEHEEVKDLRHDLVETFDLHFRDGAHLKAFDAALHRRVRSEIDSKQLMMQLGAPLSNNGVGLDPRTARKVAQRIDLLLLGSYRGAV